MSLSIECHECGHTGRVSPAKAGKTIPCPSCAEPIEVSKNKSATSPAPRGSASAGRRPKADNSIGLIALLGSTALLVGIMAMYWIKKNQLGEEVSFSLGPVISEPNAGGEPGVSIPDADAGDAMGGSGATATNVSVTTTEPATEAPDKTAEPVTANPPPKDAAPDIILPDVQAVSPQVALLAGITEVVFEVNPLYEDSRGTVQGAIKSNCTSELTKCRLKCVEGEDAPKLVVDLDLRNVGGIQKLGMKAQLQADMLGIQVVVWDHDAALVPIDKKALNGGVSLPGLDREVARFFVSLREKIKTSKTAINSIKEINRRKAAEKASNVDANG